MHSASSLVIYPLLLHRKKKAMRQQRLDKMLMCRIGILIVLGMALEQAKALMPTTVEQELREKRTVYRMHPNMKIIIHGNDVPVHENANENANEKANEKANGVGVNARSVRASKANISVLQSELESVGSVFPACQGVGTFVCWTTHSFHFFTPAFVAEHVFMEGKPQRPTNHTFLSNVKIAAVLAYEKEVAMDREQQPLSTHEASRFTRHRPPVKKAHLTMVYDTSYVTLDTQDDPHDPHDPHVMDSDDATVDESSTIGLSQEEMKLAQTILPAAYYFANYLTRPLNEPLLKFQCDSMRHEHRIGANMIVEYSCEAITTVNYMDVSSALKKVESLYIPTEKPSTYLLVPSLVIKSRLPMYERMQSAQEAGEHLNEALREAMWREDAGIEDAYAAYMAVVTSFRSRFEKKKRKYNFFSKWSSHPIYQFFCKLFVIPKWVLAFVRFLYSYFQSKSTRKDEDLFKQKDEAAVATTTTTTPVHNGR